MCVQGTECGTRSTQPSLVMITDNYAAALENNGPALRSTLDAPSDDELLAALRVFAAAAGPYEMSGSTLTLAPTAASHTNLLNVPGIFEISFDGNDSMTSVSTNADTGLTTTRRYVRVE